MQPYKIDKPIRLIELFAGIGSQVMALRNLGADFTTYRTCEWWIQPNASYKTIHCADDTKDYSADFSKEQIAEKLSRWEFPTTEKIQWQKIKSGRSRNGGFAKCTTTYGRRKTL